MSFAPLNINLFPPDFPRPESHAVAISEQLVMQLREEIIQHGGIIPFSRYQEQVLYAPGLGYYSAGAEKLGPVGDFITAPEVSSLFSRCLARQCAQLLKQLPGAGMLELGAGTGVMAAELLAELHRLGQMPSEYAILETSASLRARQSITLASRVPKLAGRVRWLDTLPKRGWRGIVLGNEVLDALPVELFRKSSGGVEQGFVTWAEDRFQLGFAMPQDERLVHQLRVIEAELGPLADGYRSELNLAMAAWISALAEPLGQGAFLFLDYGYPRREYYHPQRTMGTLICHYRHRAHSNPFILPGLQDITSFVDFSAVAEAALAADLALAGYTNQAHFLLGCGLLELAGDMTHDPERQVRLATEIKQLTLPSAMGERFKAIGFTRNLTVPWVGFQSRDLSAML